MLVVPVQQLLQPRPNPKSPVLQPLPVPAPWQLLLRLLRARLHRSQLKVLVSLSPLKLVLQL